MTVTLPARRPRAGALRDVAAEIDELPGFRVEIVGGAIVMSPTPVGVHAGVVRRVAAQLDRRLPSDRVPEQVTSIDSGRGDGEDYAIPDIAVLPIDIEQATDWLFPADIVDLVVEVVSAGNPDNDLRVKPAVYGRWGIPIYLLIDPRDGSIMLYDDPTGGQYRGRHEMRFGDTVELPDPLKGITIETADLPRYPTGG